jgi:hypothetical protein
MSDTEFTYSLEWCNADDIKHLCVVRSDDRDDMFRQVRAVEDFIKKAARARHRPDRTASPTGTPKPAIGPEAEGDDHWLSLKQLADQLPAFSYRQIKWLMSNREQNGLTRYVRHTGRRLFIRESGFMEWINQQKDGA